MRAMPNKKHSMLISLKADKRDSQEAEKVFSALSAPTNLEIEAKTYFLSTTFVATRGKKVFEAS
jgi:hypothetical protein